MRLLSRGLVLFIMLAVGAGLAGPAAAQFVMLGDVDLASPEKSLSTALEDVIMESLSQKNLPVASRLIPLFEAASPDDNFWDRLAIGQASAGDWQGSDRTLSRLRDHRSRAYVLSQTAVLLAQQGTQSEAPGRFIEAWREAIQVRNNEARQSALAIWINAAIRARYGELMPVVMQRFEQEARDDIQYAPGMSEFSQLTAENGDTREAIRLYNKIPVEVWKKYDTFGGELGQNVPSPRPAIAAAYLRAGNSEAAWMLYNSMTSRREKEQTLMALEDAALRSPSKREARALLEKIVMSAQANSQNGRQWVPADFVARLEIARSPLFSAFADLRRYHLTLSEEIQLRLQIAYLLGSKHTRDVVRWIAALPRLLSQVADDRQRNFLTLRYADALWYAGIKADARALLQTMLRAAANNPDPGQRISLLSGIATRERDWNDASGQKRTDLLTLREMQEHPTAWPPFMASYLIVSFLRHNDRDSALAALDLYKQAGERYAAEHKTVNPFTTDIAGYEGFVNGTRELPPAAERTADLKEALRIPDEKRRARELQLYVSQQVQLHQLKQAVQALPLFALPDDKREQLKLALGLRCRRR